MLTRRPNRETSGMAAIRRDAELVIQKPEKPAESSLNRCEHGVYIIDGDEEAVFCTVCESRSLYILENKGIVK